MATSTIDFLTTFKSELDCVVKHVEAAVAAEAQRAQEVKDNYDAEKAVLESKLRDQEKNVLEKDSAISELQENLTAKVRELENELQAKTVRLQNSESELASYKNSPWRSVEKLNLWKKIFHREHSGPSTTSATSQHPENYEQTRLSSPFTLDLKELEDPPETPYAVDRHQQEATKPRKPLKPKKIVNLRS